MKKTWISIALLALAAPAMADSVRCQGQIIEPGVSKYEVLKYCGAPNHAAPIGSTTIKSNNTKVETRTDEWFYEKLDYGKDYVIIINGTRVSSVKQLD
jgi:hypothetical protein